MKIILLLFLIVSISTCLSQTYDTAVVETGKPGGYERIREFDTYGNIKQIWFTIWKNEGTTVREHWNYNDQQLFASNSETTSHVIAEFTGNNIRNTTPFEVTSPWEVQWNAKGNFFSIYLYAEDGRLINVLGNQTLPGEGSSYYPKAGKYYFSVSTVGDWSLKVVKAE